MSRLKYLFFLLLFLFSARIYSQNPNWNSLLIIPANPSPYISDWENNPNNITYSLQYLGQGSATIVLEFSIGSDNLGELLSGSSNEIEFTGPQQQNIQGTDLVNWDETTWNRNIESQVIRTGRFPEGHYTACIEAYDLNEILLTESCQEFTIAYPDPPYLIAPLSADSVDTPYPTFQWSPVINTFSSDPIVYNIRIVELLKGQTPEQAITANYPHFEEKINITTLSYPPSAQLLEKNKTYVWQITALDENDVPIASNNGESEIWTFKYKIASPFEEITFVNDGIAGDEDYTSNTKQLSANWSEILNANKYFYAIGTTKGGTNIVNWTDNGLFSNFTKTGLNLTVGTEYFVTVRAEKSDGSSTSVKTSDGIVVKNTSPIELLTNVDTKIINYNYNNFRVTTAGDPNPDSINTKMVFTITGYTGKEIDISSMNITWKDKNNNILKVENKVPIEQYTNESTPFILKSDEVGKYLYLIPAYLNSFFKEKIQLWIDEYNKLAQDYSIKIKNDPSIKAEDILSLLRSFLESQEQTYIMNVVFEGSYLENNIQQKITSEPIELTLNYHNYASNRKYIIVSSSKTNLNYYYDNFRVTTFGDPNPDSINTKMVFKITGSTGKEIDISSMNINWKDKNNNILKVENKVPIDQYTNESIPFILKSDEVGKYLDFIPAYLNSFFKEKIQLWIDEFNKLAQDYSIKIKNDPSIKAEDIPSLLKSFLESQEKTYIMNVVFEGSYLENNIQQKITSDPIELTLNYHNHARNMQLIDVSKLKVEFVNDTIIYTPNTLSNYETTKLSFKSLVPQTLTIDSLVNYWYRKKDNSLYTKIKVKAIPLAVLTSGLTITKQSWMTLSYADLTSALQGKSTAEYYVHIEYIGKDNNGQRVTGKTITPLIVKCYSQNENENNLVEFITKEIEYAPDNLQNKVKIKFTHYADLTSPYIDIDSSIFCWYKEDNSLFFKDKDQTSFKPFKVDYVISSFEIEPYFDLQSFTNALDGKDSVTYKFHIEYIGREKSGKRVTCKTKTPLLVKFYAEKISPLNVEFVTKEIVLAPNDLKNNVKINLTLKGTSNAEVIIDSSINYWYKEDNTLFLEDKDIVGTPFTIKEEETLSRNINFKLEPQSLVTALEGKDRAKNFVYVEYIGKDKNGQRVTGKSQTPLNVIYQSSPISNLKADFSDNTITYTPNNLSNSEKINISYQGKSDETVTIDSVITYWFNKSDNSLYKEMKSAISPAINLTGVSSLTRNANLALDNASLSTALAGKQKAEYYVNLEYRGKDNNGTRITGKTQKPLNVLCLASSVPGLNVEFTDSIITYTPDHLNNSVDINLFYQEKSNEVVTIDSLINYWYNKNDNSLYKAMSEVISPEINLTGGSSLTRIANLTLDNAGLTTALDGKHKAEFYVNIEYIGKDKNENRITGKTKAPLNVICSDTTNIVSDTTVYPLIPKVAYIKPIPNQTTIQTSGSKITFDGTVKLLLSSSPFKNDSTYVEAVNLTFQKENNGYKVTGGTFFGEAAPGAEEDLFNFKFASVLKVQVQQLSYNFNRANKLLINSAFAKIPVIDKKIVFKDLVIDKNGLNLKLSPQELTAFGLVFIVKNFSNTKSSTGNSKLSLGVGLRLNNKNSKEFFSGELVVQKVKGGETTVELKGAEGGGKPLVKLIPETDYLNFNSFKFVKKPKGNWAMQVGVSSSNLPIYSKINKDPIKAFFEYEKSGKMTGKVEFVNEPKHGYDKTDKSVFEIGGLGAIDLTYLGFKIEQVQKITTVDSKPDTSWEFDFGKSQIGISADLYLASKGKKLNDLSNAIYFGEANNPGITIDFEGIVKTQTISVSKDKKIDLGPVFLHMTDLAFTPYPFELSISGGIGVAMKDVFSGEIVIENLKINDEGKITNLKDKDVVKGGNLSIVKFLDLNIDKLQFSSTPTTLAYDKNTGSGTAKSSLQVDSYFLLEGASLTFGKSGAAGGKLKRLLVYETGKKQDGSGGNTNFILNEGTLSIKDAIDLTIDIEYVKGDKEEHLGVGGTVNLFSKGKSSGYGGTVYGEIGKRKDGTEYWGFYVQANLGETGIPLGPVNLTGVGGGFFYHPTKANIQKVTSLAKFTPLKISGVDKDGKPKLSNNQKWALFLYASMSIAGPDLIHGKAFITVTNSYFKLNAEVKAIKEKAHGKAFLNINWDQDFVEGRFQFGIDLVVIKAVEKNNFFQFYAYSKSKWGVMGKTDIRCFLIKTTSDIYVGNQGFLFDFALEESIDIYVISGGFRIEAMTWWRKNVSWGIYASGKAWGDVLGGLIGAEIGVEGALISNPFLIYVGGHLKVEVCWVDVFNGRAWITISEDGLDGGTGGNDKFDKLISDARNIGKQMKNSMKDLQKELEDTRDALFQLSEAQRLAAGKTLMQLSAWSGEGGIGNLYKDWFKFDLHGRIYPYDKVYESDIPTQGLLNNYNVIWNSKASELDKINTKLENDSIAIANAIDDIKLTESTLAALLSNNSDLLEGELPSLTELSKLKNPVTERTFTSSTITVNDTIKQVTIFDYNLDSKSANNLKKSVTDQKKELEAYQKKLVSMVGEYVTKLNEIKEILSGNSISVKSMAKKYAATFDMISNYTIKFMGYLREKNLWATNQSNKLMKPSDFDLDIQRTWTDPSTAGDYDKITKQRIDIINSLIKSAKAFKPPSNNISYDNYKDMGTELYYNIPKAGYESVTKEVVNAIPTFITKLKANNDVYQAKWNMFTIQSDKVYSREAKLYTILYDLFDQLSLEAGTRKLEKASSGDMVVDTESGSTAQNYLIPIVGSDGIVSVSSGSSTSSNIYTVGDINTTGSSGNTSFQQIAGSNLIDASTGNNVSQNQLASGQVTKKGEWAKGWDFEKERKTVKKILQVPKITQFSGTAISDENTWGNYSILTLNWVGEHPIGIADYSFSIDGYSDPIQAGSNSADNSSEDAIYGQLNTSPTFNPGIFGTNDNSAGDNNSADVTLGNEPDTHNPDSFVPVKIGETNEESNRYSSDSFESAGTGSNQEAWRTVGSKQTLAIPFFKGVHSEGSYNIWARARGTGGYTLSRAGSVNIEYTGGANSQTGRDFDWSKRESSLDITDNTPPTTPSVSDGANITSSLNTLIVSWSSADYESGIQEYQYQVVYDKDTGGRNNYQEVTPWVSAGGQTELTIRLDQQLIPGKTYYVLIKAINGVGMWSDIGWSDGITLKDPTPPTKPSFTQTGRRGSNLDYVTIFTDSLLSSTWYPASDPESEIIGYLFALGTTEGATDVIGWCGVKSTKIRLDITQLKKLLNANLQKYATYYLSIKAMNGIGVTGEPAIQAVVMN